MSGQWTTARRAWVTSRVSLRRWQVSINPFPAAVGDPDTQWWLKWIVFVFCFNLFTLMSFQGQLRSLNRVIFQSKRFYLKKATRLVHEKAGTNPVWNVDEINSTVLPHCTANFLPARQSIVSNSRIWYKVYNLRSRNEFSCQTSLMSAEEIIKTETLEHVFV